MIVVLCPTRGRPHAALEMAKSFRDTATLFATELILVVDSDDPLLGEYADVVNSASLNVSSTRIYLPPNSVRLMVVPGGSLTKATNDAAARVWDDDCIIGHVGDDHRFRTVGWDVKIERTLSRPGVAYGDDLLQHATLPTAVFMSSVIPRTLGWYALPGTAHMKIDTAWKDLGALTGRLRYMPEIVIEHLHPSVGKSPEDDGYQRARDGRRRDKEVYMEWVTKSRARDIEALRRVL